MIARPQITERMIIMTVTIPGYSSIIGQPTTILAVMQEARMFDAPKGDAYIDTVVADTKRLYDVNLTVTGDTYEQRAESLLREMAKADLITIEEE